MKKLRTAILAIVLSLGSGFSLAGERIWKNGPNNAVLKEAPCESKKGALAQIPDSARKNMKSASIFFNGERFEACWYQVDEKRVFLFDESGDAGIVDDRAFVPYPEA